MMKKTLKFTLFLSVLLISNVLYSNKLETKNTRNEEISQNTSDEKVVFDKDFNTDYNLNKDDNFIKNYDGETSNYDSEMNLDYHDPSIKVVTNY